MNLQSLLVFVVPIALWAFQCFGGIVDEIFTQSGRVEDEIALGTLNTWLSSVHMIRTRTYKRHDQDKDLKKT